jgi:hypothetical protein
LGFFGWKINQLATLFERLTCMSSELVLEEELLRNVALSASASQAGVRMAARVRTKVNPAEMRKIRKLRKIRKCGRYGKYGNAELAMIFYSSST